MLTGSWFVQLCCTCVQVVMSAVWGGGMMGVAYYLVDTGHLYIMPDAAEREDFGLLRRSKDCACNY